MRQLDEEKRLGTNQIAWLKRYVPSFAGLYDAAERMRADMQEYRKLITHH